MQYKILCSTKAKLHLPAGRQVTRYIIDQINISIIRSVACTEFIEV